MKLYEIDQAIYDCVDEETGEIIDVEKFEALQMDRLRKLEGIALWVKELRAEAEAIKAEKDKLYEREVACKNKADRLANFLSDVLGGEKFRTPRVAVSYRKSTKVDIPDSFDVDSLPEELKKVKRTVDPDKKAIGDYLKAGNILEGISLLENYNIQIK